MSEISDIITIAKVAQPLAMAGQEKAGLYGGVVKRDLATHIYCVRKNVEWLNALSSTDSTLPKTARYLYALCAPYSMAAQVIINLSGGGTVIRPAVETVASSSIGWLRITSIDFTNTTDYINAELADLEYRIYANWIARYLEPTEWAYASGGGFSILIPGFDATAESYELFIDVKGAIPLAQVTGVRYDLDANAFVIPNLHVGVSFEEQTVEVFPNGFTYDWDTNFLFSETWAKQPDAIAVSTLQVYTFRFLSSIGKWICVGQSINVPN
jgi:hypothetical protein